MYVEKMTGAIPYYALGAQLKKAPPPLFKEIINKGGGLFVVQEQNTGLHPRTITSNVQVAEAV